MYFTVFFSLMRVGEGKIKGRKKGWGGWGGGGGEKGIQTALSAIRALG